MPPSRRQFLAAVAGSAIAARAAAAGDPPPLPRRPLGRTGLTVPILGFGSGSRFLMYATEDAAIAALHRAIDRGIAYIDTAHSYGDGLSERRVGMVMKERRREVVLATKIAARDGDEARRQLDRSLARLQTDRLDIVHIHALASPADLEAIERPGGVLRALLRARDEKVFRCLGITSHADPASLKLAIERHDFDCTQMALNAALARMADLPGGMKAERQPRGGFEELALPAAVAKGLGVIAMKVFGQDQIRPGAAPEQMLGYALSLPVAMASVGMPRVELIDRNAEIARRFEPLDEAERRAIVDSIARDQKVGMADYLRDHRDA